MKALVTIVRIIVGLLFIFSGLIKANDPLGLAYKMDEYFAVWHWDWATPFSLYLSISMNVFEIVAGIALLLGYKPKLVTWLLLLLILFFTFLTGYAVFSGKIKTCGCFGDCIPLQAHQSFIKDLVLLAMILFLFMKRKLIEPFLSARINLVIVLFFTGFFTFGQLNVLQSLPYIDCLPYAKGKNLLQQMEPPPGSTPDSTVTMFKYNKAGKEISFDAADFPADFDDSLYQFVGRETVVVRKGNAVAKIQDFALYSLSGEDTTKAILEKTGNYFFFFARNFDGTKPGWQELFSKIYLKAKDKGIPMYLVTNQPAKVQAYFNETNHFNLPVLTCDGTVMKTILRTKTGIVAMNGATVAGKWSEKNMNDIIAFLNNAKK
ncbi:MAG: BT_3928 family protein [Bacteroidota bacterium]